ALEGNENKDGRADAVTRLLLLHHGWDKESLLEKYYEGPENAVQMMIDAGIDKTVAEKEGENSSAPGSPTKRRSSAKSKSSLPTTFECGICMEPAKPTWRGEDAGCGHRFCRDCYRDYISSRILSGTMNEWATCPQSDCEQLVSHEQIESLLSADSHALQLYARFLVNSYVDSHKSVKWCPAPDCEFAVRVREGIGLRGVARKVTCLCGAVFCVACGEEWHEPSTCVALAHWLRKSERDGPTLQWIATNTKECPRCHVPIEKDGGCNHVMCKSPSCKYDFCWVCLGPWESHGSSWYSCNRFDATEAQAARDAQKASRLHLSRYLHYYSRFVNHRKSVEFERQLYDVVRRRAEEVIAAQPRLTWVDLHFLKRAVDVLLECRQTLKHTYVFAYYLKKCNQGDIFEGNQSDLETATETLSEYLERDITTDNFSDVKQKAARDAQKASRLHLSRYLHYYSRFVNHRKSVEFERQLYDVVRRRAEEVIAAQPRLTWVDLHFLKRAVDVLLECRQTLKHTYVFAYYLKKCNQGDIFEGNQSDLETATETLSEYLERDITTDNFSDVKQKVHDKLTYCSSRRQVLVDHVSEGSRKNWWDFDYGVGSAL
ncbi:unnamed protein product, partial [Notodromas monacha]